MINMIECFRQFCFYPICLIHWANLIEMTGTLTSSLIMRLRKNVTHAQRNIFVLWSHTSFNQNILRVTSTDHSVIGSAYRDLSTFADCKGLYALKKSIVNEVPGSTAACPW